MGIPLQTYRIRIGSFQPYLKIGSSSKQKRSSQYKASLSPKSGILLLILIIFLPAFIHLNRESYEATSQSFDVSCCYQGKLVKRGGSVLLTQACMYHHISIHLAAPRSWLSSKHRNSLVKAVNGNRACHGRGIKCVLWNKGNSLLQNKQEDIEMIIRTHTPHFLGLCEANLRKGVDLNLVKHQDYNIHVAKSIDNSELGIARVVVYTHSSLVVKRRDDLESESLSAVWLEVGLPRQRKILIATMYREWQHLHQSDQASRSITAQLERWCNFLANWETALMEGKEVLVMGDMNLDFLKWSRTDLSPSDPSLRLKSLTEALFSRIFPHGVYQLVKEPMRIWPGQQDSGLDHIWVIRTRTGKKLDKCHIFFKSQRLLRTEKSKNSYTFKSYYLILASRVLKI